MKNKNVVFLVLAFCLFSFSALGEENEVAQEPQVAQENQGESDADNPEVFVHYTRYADMPEIKELDEKDDDLYTGAEVLPMNIQLSEEEKQQDPSADFDYIDSEYEMPELPCNNEKLTKEVARFIRDNTEVEENSVKSRRSRILLIKNLHNFNEINESDLSGKDNFKTKAALMYLRINRSQEISRVCESKNNTFGKYSNVYLIIYPYMKYYKVVVTNLISIPEKMDEATFVHNW
ncbi:MAG: hypothetical protein IJ532_03060 [Alphaproteobacteria bacterium]|nr:hypothetical protein [Alphaproteobacteria bacterium]